MADSIGGRQAAYFAHLCALALGPGSLLLADLQEELLCLTYDWFETNNNHYIDMRHTFTLAA